MLLTIIDFVLLFLAFNFDKLLRPVINFYHYEFSSEHRFPIP
jgi:hypothetical protein